MQPVPTIDPESVSAAKRMKSTDGDNPLVAEYKDLVDQLADCLKLARHPKESQTIEAARILIEKTLLQNEAHRENVKIESADEVAPLLSSLVTSRAGIRQSDDEIRIQRAKFKLDDVTLPASSALLSSQPRALVGQANLSQARQSSATATATGDDDAKKDELEKSFEHAAKALRLLYLFDQKQLQNQVNQVILGIQSITANPRIESRLQATGRR